MKCVYCGKSVTDDFNFIKEHLKEHGYTTGTLKDIAEVENTDIENVVYSMFEE